MRIICPSTSYIKFSLINRYLSQILIMLHVPVFLQHFCFLEKWKDFIISVSANARKQSKNYSAAGQYRELLTITTNSLISTPEIGWGRQLICHTPMTGHDRQPSTRQQKTKEYAWRKEKRFYTREEGWYRLIS